MSGVTGTTSLHVDHSPSNDRRTNVVFPGVTMSHRPHGTTTHRPTATTAPTSTSPGTGTTMTKSTQSTADKTSLRLNCIGYNCKCFKQSIDCVALLLPDCDIIGLCETWLRPGELPVMKSSLGIMPEHCSDDLLVFSKSGMEDTPPEYRGRPYGGVALVCKQHSVLVYHELETNNRRCTGM